VTIGSGLSALFYVFAAIALYKAEFTDASIQESTYHLTSAVLNTLIAGRLDRRLR
jgi:hypothetical protein